MLMNLLSGGITAGDLVNFVTRLFIILMILPLHEYAHAWAAYKLGDDTAMYQGRLTLNPLAHVDPIGAICLLLCGFGWAKPVPINPNRFSRKHSMRFGVAITALAGPMANLVAAFFGMVIQRFYELSDYWINGLESLAGSDSMNMPMMIYFMLNAFVTINLGLCVFNLIPIPPLDGSKILSYFTSGKFDRWFIRNQQVIRIVFLILLFSPVLTIPMGILRNLLYSLLTFATNWIPLLFG